MRDQRARDLSSGPAPNGSRCLRPVIPGLTLPTLSVAVPRRFASTISSNSCHPICSSRRPSTSAQAHMPKVCQNPAHIDKAADNTQHRIVGMNFILQIDEALVLYRTKSFKNLLHRHDAFSHWDLAVLALKIREVLHVYVKQPCAYFVDGLNHVRA